MPSASQADLQLSLSDVDFRVGNAEYILTNNLTDFFYIREKVDELGTDLRGFKERSGVQY